MTATLIELGCDPRTLNTEERIKQDELEINWYGSDYEIH